MTVFQQQCLLGYLGCLGPGEVDGIPGPKTAAALERYRQQHGDTPLEAAVQAAPEDFWQQIRFFTRREFACPCGSCGGFPAEPREKLVRMADAVRQHFGAPATVSSGVRCASHNARVGGVANSRHLTGSAVDFCVRGVGAEELDAYCDTLADCAYHYPIRCNGVLTGYVHMDVL